MTWLTLQLLVGGSRARSLLVAGCTAAVTVLLLFAATVLLLPRRAEEALFDVVAEPGTRPGFVLALVMLVVPPLLLLHQAVRFGTSTREQRLAGLRLAGATPGDVRRLSTLEVGLPALAGGVLGVLGFWVLRLGLGGDTSAWSPSNDAELLAACRELDAGTCSVNPLTAGVGRLVPQSVTLPWWAFVLLALGVGLVGASVGARLGSRLALSPHGVVRRRPERVPRPWGVGLLVVAAVGLPLLLLLDDRFGGGPLTSLGLMATVVLAVVGVVSLGPWVAHRAGTRALAQTDDAAVLLAASRLLADPRPAGRAAAAVGGIGLVGGGATAVLVSLVADDQAEAYYLVPLGLIGLCLLGCLVVACGAIAVHAVEQLHDRRRSVAAQVAQGVPLEVLVDSLRWEARLVAVPLGATGAVLGALAVGAVSTWYDATAVLLTVLFVLLGVLFVGGLVRVAVAATARLLGPAVRASSGPDNLRTA